MSQPCSRWGAGSLPPAASPPTHPLWPLMVPQSWSKDSSSTKWAQHWHQGHGRAPRTIRDSGGHQASIKIVILRVLTLPNQGDHQHEKDGPHRDTGNENNRVGKLQGRREKQKRIWEHISCRAVCTGGAALVLRALGCSLQCCSELAWTMCWENTSSWSW